MGIEEPSVEMEHVEYIDVGREELPALALTLCGYAWARRKCSMLCTSFVLCTLGFEFELLCPESEVTRIRRRLGCRLGVDGGAGEEKAE